MTCYRLVSSSLMFAIATLVPIFCLAQAPIPGGIASGAITLEVIDAEGSPIPGVTLNARNVANEVTFTVVSDSSGRIRIPAVPVGTYQVQASLEGFATMTKTVTVGVGQASTVQFVLGGPVPGGIGNGASDGGASGRGAPATTGAGVVDVETSVTDDDVALQQLLGIARRRDGSWHRRSLCLTGRRSSSSTRARRRPHVWRKSLRAPWRRPT